jgi:putative SOS response-associated peptidase YedK
MGVALTMCGRARLSSDVSEIKIAFGIPPERPTPNFAASWNVAPTDPLPVVRHDTRDRQRSLEVMRWGLIPYWAKDDKIGFSTINARAEEVDTKPAFREPFLQRRCLVRWVGSCRSSVVEPAAGSTRYAPHINWQAIDLTRQF